MLSTKSKIIADNIAHLRDLIIRNQADMSEFNCKVISYKNQITNIENNFKTSVDQNQDLKNENEDLKQQIMESKSEINNLERTLKAKESET